MTSTRPGRAAPRRAPIGRARAAALLAAATALAAGAASRPPGSAASLVAGPAALPHGTHAPGPGPPPRPLGVADGAIPDGTSVFDDGVAGVARLDPALRGALRAAASAAARDGVGLRVNSGWRSTAYQEQLLEEAVARYGSRAAAARWVAPPDRSAHVSGDAVDVGPASAAAWLAAHGAAYGLCRTYANEPWHYERRPDAAAGCAAPYADPTHDPRLRP